MTMMIMMMIVMKKKKKKKILLVGVTMMTMRSNVQFSIVFKTTTYCSVNCLQLARHVATV